MKLVIFKPQAAPPVGSIELNACEFDELRTEREIAAMVRGEIPPRSFQCALNGIGHSEGRKTFARQNHT